MSWRREAQAGSLAPMERSCCSRTLNNSAPAIGKGERAQERMMNCIRKLQPSPSRDKLSADPALLRAVRAWRRAKAMIALARLGEIPRRAA